MVRERIQVQDALGRVGSSTTMWVWGEVSRLYQVASLKRGRGRGRGRGHEEKMKVGDEGDQCGAGSSCTGMLEPAT